MALALSLHGYFLASGAASKANDINSNFNKKNKHKITKFGNKLKDIPYVYLVNNDSVFGSTTGSLGDPRIWFETDLVNRPVLSEMIETVIKVNRSRATVILPNFDHLKLIPNTSKKFHADLLNKLIRMKTGLVFLDHEHIEDLMSYTSNSFTPEDVSTILDVSIEGYMKLKNHIKGWKHSNDKKREDFFPEKRKLQNDLFDNTPILKSKNTRDD